MVVIIVIYFSLFFCRLYFINIDFCWIISKYMTGVSLHFEHKNTHNLYFHELPCFNESKHWRSWKSTCRDNTITITRAVIAQRKGTTVSIIRQRTKGRNSWFSRYTEQLLGLNMFQLPAPKSRNNHKLRGTLHECDSLMGFGSCFRVFLVILTACIYISSY